MSKFNILFQLSGSIACFKSCALISRLVKDGHQVQTLCTPSTLKFLGGSTLEGLTGRPVISDLFLPGHQMSHIHLTKWCDWSILCPASADTLNRLANGLANDMVGAIFLAFDRQKPYWIAPAMNPSMYQHPATQESLRKLKHWGVRVLEPEEGPVACGDTGEGRLMDPDTIYRRILAQPARSLNLLITSGATCENIDGVRFLSNVSTGSTGATIADYFVQKGHRVTYLHATQAKQASERTLSLSFRTTQDLDDRLHKLLQEPYDAIIHAAAVSDYAVNEIVTNSASLKAGQHFKIASTEDLTITLKPLPKLLDKIRSYSKQPKQLLVVAFKLTCNADNATIHTAVNKLLHEGSADYVVQNDLSEIDPSRNMHKANIFSKTGIIGSTPNKKELAQLLETILVGREGDEPCYSQ